MGFSMIHSWKESPFSDGPLKKTVRKWPMKLEVRSLPLNTTYTCIWSGVTSISAIFRASSPRGKALACLWETEY